MTELTWDEAVERRLHEIRELAEKFAAAKGQRVQLQEFRKSKKAILMQQAEGYGVKSVAAQEREAYAHPQYIDLLDSLQIAVEQEEKLSWQLELKRWRFESWRTYQANQRAERQRYGT